MLTLADILALVAILVAIPLYLHFIDVPRMRRKIGTGGPDARWQAYRTTILQQWAICGALLLGWTLAHRPAGGLLLVWPHGFGLWAALAFALVGIVLAALQAASVAKALAARPGARTSLDALEWLLPHTAREAAWFRALSVTAGVCEEVVFRGYVTWALSQWLPMPAAVVAQALAFGLAHSYQGRGGIVKTGLVGLVMGAIASGSGSLLAPIVMHAAFDLSAGRIAEIIFGSRAARPAGGSGNATASAGVGDAGAGAGERAGAGADAGASAAATAASSTVSA
jgi:membrane protease YdiL (CAAX protease family)